MRTTFLVASLATLLFLAPLASAAPANDALADAVDLGALPATTSVDTTDATEEAGEPLPCGAMGSTVWFTMTAALDGFAIVDALGSDYDTVLAAYEGTSLGDLATVACNDDTYGLLSEIFFPTVAGTTYFLQAGGFLGDVGTLVVNAVETNVSCVSGGPANDCLADAVVIPSAPYTASQSTLGADAEFGEPSPCAPIGATVWFTWIAPASMPVAATTLGSDYDTTLAVYTGTTVSDLATVACNDDVAPTVLSSALTFAAVGGTTYFFQLGGYFGDQGTLTLTAL